MTLRTLIAPIALVALALAAGCGGENASAGAANASTIAPASTQLFATVDADTSSGQWRQLQDLLDRFPGRDRLVRERRGERLDG